MNRYASANTVLAIILAFAGCARAAESPRANNDRRQQRENRKELPAARIMIPNYRGSFWKTTLLALVVVAVSLIFSITLVSSGETLALRLVWILLSLPFFLLSSLAALAALGGMIGLHRDALERRGQPYFSHKPRERSPGWLPKLRRRTSEPAARLAAKTAFLGR